jgi:hypothetical protein
VHLQCRQCLLILKMNKHCYLLHLVGLILLIEDLIYTATVVGAKVDIGLPPRFKWDLHSSAMLRSVDR